MVLELKEKTIENAKKDFLEVVNSPEATPEDITNSMAGYMTSISDKIEKQVQEEYQELQNVKDAQVLQSRGIHTLTNEEINFYNEATKKGGFDNTDVWPTTVLDRVFEDIINDHQILRLIRFMPSAGITQVIRSRRLGFAIFGPLNKDLDGQLDAEFGVTEYGQLALTAFFLIGNDTLTLGPVWIDRYVRLSLTEAIRDIWAEKIINGTGLNEPIGLLKDMDGSLSPTTGLPDKATSGTLTFADSKTMIDEIGGILKTMSTYTRKISPEDPGTEEQRYIKGRVYLIINPVNYFDIVARATVQNAAGVYVTNLPFIQEDHIIESEFVPEDKVIAFVEDNYDATMSMPEQINRFKETFAMRRATLFSIEMLGNGQPRNNDSAKVWDLKLTKATPEEASLKTKK